MYVASFDKALANRSWCGEAGSEGVELNWKGLEVAGGGTVCQGAQNCQKS